MTADAPAEATEQARETLAEAEQRLDWLEAELEVLLEDVMGEFEAIEAERRRLEQAKIVLDDLEECGNS